MAWPFKRRDREAEPEPITAAAVPYRGTPTGQRADTNAVTPRKAREWQSAAYNFYRSVWLVGEGLDMHAAMASRVALYVGYRAEDEDERPVEAMEEATRAVVPDADGSPGRPNALTPVQAQAAIDELDRMQAATGGQAAILRDLDLNLNIAGDCSLVAHPLDPLTNVADEEWMVLSVEEFRRSQTKGPDGTARYERLGPDGRWTTMPDGTVAWRIWSPDPGRRWDPKSPLQRSIDDLTTLGVLTRMVRSQARSRTSAGLQFFPNEALDKPTDPTLGEELESKVITDLQDAYLDPVSDEGDAAAVAPTIIPMDASLIEVAKAGLASIDRPFDKYAVDLRKEARDAIAGGLPLPAELVQGLGDSNHWSAAQITANAYDMYFEWAVRLLCESLTSIFRVAWLAAGIPRDVVLRMVVAADPSALIVDPDRVANSDKAYEDLLITDERRRKDLHYGETDAPSEEEVARRVALRQALNATAFPDPGAAPGIPDEGAPAPESEPIVAAATHAGRRRALATLARRLAAIDRELLLSLRAVADVELEAALVRAGNRIQSRMSRGSRGAPFPDGAESVAASLGPEAVAELGLTDDELLSRSFYGLRDRYLTLTRDAHRKALRAAVSVTGMSPQDVERAVDGAEPQREAGLDVFLGALLALARDRIYDPHPASPPMGEHDTGLRVPASLVRQSLAIAGGEAEPVLTPAGGVLTAAGEPVGGVANGPDIAAIFAASNIVTTGWVWEHGDPAVPFEPHAALDGVEFDTWQDPILTAPADVDWLDSPLMRPGDHRGCSCGFYRQLSDAAADDSESEAA